MLLGGAPSPWLHIYITENILIVDMFEVGRSEPVNKLRSVSVGVVRLGMARYMITCPPLQLAGPWALPDHETANRLGLLRGVNPTPLQLAAMSNLA